MLLTRGSDEAPASRAATLVPANALVFVHLSTDSDRDAVRKSLALAQRFPSWPTLRDQALARIGARPGEQGLRDVRKFVGDEVALALLNTGGDRADPLVLLRITDESKARSYLGTRTPPVGGHDLPRDPDSQLRLHAGGVRQGLSGPGPVRGRARGGRPRRRPRPPAGRQAPSTARPPAGCPTAAWPTAGPRPTASAVCSPPPAGSSGSSGRCSTGRACEAPRFALSPAGDGARVRVRSVLAKGAPRATPFSPSLLDSVPARAVAALDTTRIDLEAPRLLGLSSTGRSPRRAGLQAPGRGPGAAGRRRIARRRCSGWLRRETALFGARRSPGPGAVGGGAGARRGRDERGDRAPGDGSLERSPAGVRPARRAAFRPVRVAGRTAFRLDVPGAHGPLRRRAGQGRDLERTRRGSPRRCSRPTLADADGRASWLTARTR